MQQAMKRTHTYLNRNKICEGIFLVVQESIAENVQNLQFLSIE